MSARAKNLVAAVCAVVVCTVAGCSRDTSRDTSRGARRGPGSPDSSNAAATSTPPSIGSPLAPRGAYVGNRYRTLPRGVRYVSGAVLPVGRGGAEYELALLKTPRGDVVWFDSLAHSSGATPARTVRAELRVPPLGRDERLFLASCDVGGTLDTRVVAIVVNEPNVTTFTKVRQAWRVNAARGVFELIPVTGVTCEEPGG